MLLDNQAQLHVVVSKILKLNLLDKNRDTIIQIGRIIRNNLKSAWKDAVLLSLATTGHCNIDNLNHVISFVENHMLSECYDWKPIIDGIEIQKNFNIPPSKKVQEILLMEFDFMFCGIRDKDDLVRELSRSVGGDDTQNLTSL
jgi:hypothetical protein